MSPSVPVLFLCFYFLHSLLPCIAEIPSVCFACIRPCFTSPYAPLLRTLLSKTVLHSLGNPVFKAKFTVEVCSK